MPISLKLLSAFVLLSAGTAHAKHPDFNYFITSINAAGSLITDSQSADLNCQMLANVAGAGSQKWVSYIGPLNEIRANAAGIKTIANTEFSLNELVYTSISEVLPDASSAGEAEIVYLCLSVN